MLVKKGKNTYLYQSCREEGVVRTTYHGQLSPQQIHEHHKRQEEQALRKQHQQEIITLLDALDEVRAVDDLLIRTQLLFSKQ